MSGEVDRELTLEVLRRLVAIDSVNPAFPADSAGRPGAGESAAAAYVVELLEGLGLEVSRHEETPGRPSVVGVLRGAAGGRSLMLNGHLDTVGPGAMPRPFAPRVEHGRLHGRGAYDMKGPLAACVGAVEALARSSGRWRGELVLALVADEENESLGTREVLRQHVTDGAVVAEPTDMRLCLAHKGFAWLAVTTRGVARHGSDHRRGVDANLRMVQALSPLAGLRERLLAEPPHPLLGPPSLHLGRLEGGEAPSIYAARCRGQIELRTIPGGSARRARREIAALVEQARRQLGAEAVELEELLVREPFEARPESAVAAAVSGAAADLLGGAPEIIGVPFWTDAALLAGRGIDTVVFGPAGAGAHADDEWVDLDSVFDCAAVLARAARAYCDGSSS